MPNAVQYVPRPFVPDRFDPRNRLGDYARAHGRDVAEGIRYGGNLSAQNLAGIGQGIAGTLREIAAYPAQQRQAEMLAVQQQREEQAYQEAQAAKQTEQAKAQRLQQLVKEHQGQRVPTPILVQEFGPQDASEIDKAFDELFPAPKVQDDYTLNPGDVRFKGGTGQQIATVAKPEPVKEPKLHAVTVPGPNGRPMSKMFTEEELQAGVPVYREPKEPKSDTEPLVAIMGPDGSPILVRRSEAEGKRPASNREQGRPVTSGDAGRIADVDEALKLGLSLNFKPGDTGIMPSLGGWMPDAVTNLTGFGVGAKQRQGVINLVKQIIGKGLEGGVLRKEDEAKYEKMLPTLSDHPDVVTAKVANLKTTLDQKRTTLLDALADAGYDTSKFTERGSPLNRGTTAVPDLTGLKEGFKARITSGPFAGQEWTLLNGKPTRVK